MTRRRMASAVFLCSLLAFTLPGPAAAEPHGHRWKPGRADSCLSLDELVLSSGQREAVKELSGPCRNRIFRLRTELIGKHMELKRKLRDPSVAEDEIEEAWREVEELHASMRGEVKRYTLSIRRILTPEQIREWCAIVETGPRRGRR